MQVNIIAPQETKDLDSVRTHTLLVQLKNATPAQVETYVENHVTTLPEAKEVLKALAVAVGYLVRKI